MRIDRLIPILLAAPAMAQTPPGPTVIRTETRVVLVDAVVTGRNGDAIPGLTAKNFKVFEDGKEQTIQSVSYVADPSTAQKPTYLVLFFDNVSLDGAAQDRARGAAMQFIEANSGPNHYMAIVNYDGGTAISQNFTTDTDRLKRVVSENITTGPTNLTMGGGRIRAGGSTIGTGPDGLAHGLWTLAANLSGVPGRKNVVLFSNGYTEAPQINAEIHNAVEASNRSDVAIYAVDLSGVTQPGAPDVSHSVRAGGGRSRGGAADTPSAVAENNQQILYSLAQPTGGFVATHSNDLLAGLLKIGKEQTDYYLLGYTPPESPDGSCHPLKVKVEAPGATVRSRVSYCNVKAVDLLAGKPVEQELEYRVTGNDAGTIAASLEVPFFYTDPDTARINVAMDIPSSAIHFEKVKGKSHGEMNIVGIAYLPDGTAAARFSDTVKLDLATPKEMGAFLAKPLHYEKEFFVAPGKYTLKVAFTSGSDGFGKLQAPLEIQPYNGKQFMLSGLALSKEVHPVSELGSAEDAELIEGRTPLVYKEAKIVPAGGNQFSRTDPVAIYGEVYEPLANDPKPPIVELRMRIVDSAGAAKFTGALRPEVTPHPGTIAIPFALKLKVDNLTPGAYRADVEAVDSAGKTMLRSVDFAIK